MSQGTSWKVTTSLVMVSLHIGSPVLQNLEECGAIVQLASIFQAQGKKFRIITPYDAQRSLIEKELEKAELEWRNTCFNVDSFQGKSIFCC